MSDGQLARLLDRTSPEGSALDHAFDDIKTLSLSIALTFGYLSSLTAASTLAAILGGGSLILTILLSYAFSEGSRDGLSTEITAADDLAHSTRSGWMRGVANYYRFRLRCLRSVAIAAGIPLAWSDSMTALQTHTGRLSLAYWLSVGPSAAATALAVCALSSLTGSFLRSLVVVGPVLLACGLVLHHAGRWVVNSANEPHR